MAYISNVQYNGNTKYIKDRVTKTFSGTCSTAAGTAIKDVTCDAFRSTDLQQGAIIFVTFTNTNSAAVGDIRLRVNSDAANDAKPIKYLVNGNNPADLPAVGYLRTNQTYRFHYDGTNWVVDINYNVNTYLRVYTQNTGYNADYPVLVGRTAASTLTAKSNGSTTDVYGIIYTSNAPTLNPSTGLMKLKGLTVTDTITGDISGNAATATNASKVNNHTVNKDVPADAVFTDTTYEFDGTYNSSSNKAATVSTVTNAINALDGGTIGTGSTIKTITSLSQNNGNVSATFENIVFPVTSVNGLTGAITLDQLGITGAMHFKGITTTAMTDGRETATVTINNESYTPNAGDVILYSDSEYVWTGSSWERLGRDSSFKIAQTAVTDSAYSGTDTATTFVTSVTQNTNGEITVTKRNLPTYNNYSHPTGDGNLHVPATGTTHNGYFLKAGSTAGSISWAQITVANITDFPSTMTPSSHTHGNISNTGTIGQTTSWSLTSNDGLVVFDSSNSNKLERSAITFDTTDDTKVLSKKGTWVDRYTHPALNHIPTGGSDGQFLGYDSSGTAKWVDNPNTDEKVYQSASSSSSWRKILLSGGTVYSAWNTAASTRTEQAYQSTKLAVKPEDGSIHSGGNIIADGTINGLTLTAATTGFTIAGGTTSKTLTVSNTYTLGAACEKAFDTSISDSSTSANLPTSAAVASFVEGKGYITSHYEAKIFVTASSGTSNVTSDTSDPYIAIVENSTRNNAIQIKAGTNISVVGKNGIITISNTYSHPNANHIPSGGSTGQFLQYSGTSGTATWHTLTASDIPSLSDTYLPLHSAADSVGHDLTLTINTGTTEGTSQYTFNGSATKTLDIKAGSNITLTASEGELTIAAQATRIEIVDLTGG